MHPSVSGVYSTLVLLLPRSGTTKSYHAATRQCDILNQPSQFDSGIAFDVREAWKEDAEMYLRVHHWLSSTVVHDEIEQLIHAAIPCQ
jgi:hypothetical protein